MGNAAGKEATGSSGSASGRSQSNAGISTSTFTREYLAEPSGYHQYRQNMKTVSKRKRDKDTEKVKIREKQIMELVIKYNENVDGGYLAPFDNYKYGLGYNTEIVRSLIIKRKLSPFFTPLQDFDASWSNDELLSYLRENLTLHENIKPNDLNVEYEDPNEHKLHLSANALRRKETKNQINKIKERAAELQNFENSKFKKNLRYSIKEPTQYLDIPSNDLLLRIYKNAEECPICFLFFPKFLNTTRCCSQPICTECFVQMKRSEPHFPHDENDEGTPAEEEETDPEKLISEPVKCPFCAVPNFGVIYTPPTDFSTGVEGSCKAGEFKFIDNTIVEEEQENGIEDTSLTEIDLADPFSTKKEKNEEMKKQRGSSGFTNTTKIELNSTKRRSLIPADSDNVITVDAIRPDWEQNLLAARTKMARRSAAATALHATSIMDNDEPGYAERHGQRNNRGNRHSSRAPRSYQQQQQLEERLIEEAMRLSLLDEEERQLKERLKKKGM